MWRNALQSIKVSVGWPTPWSARADLEASRIFRRTFYASKWQKRLGHLLEGRRRAPPPEIPEKETRGRQRRRALSRLAYKIGCMSLWDEWGVKHMVTVCQLDRLHVLTPLTLQKNGYEEGERLGGSGTRFPISVRHFVPGQWVFVSGWSKGRGYHGVMKRWGFAGGGSDKRGHKKDHRSAGSLGQRGVGKVWKYKKMAGHKGPDPRCMNAKVFRIESARNLIFLKGPLPGYKGSVVKIHDARGKTAFKNKHIRLPFPTFVPMPGVEYPVTVQE
eukprot:g11815.t1